MAKSPREVTQEIIAGLDVLAEFRALGVEIVGEPRASGFVSCKAYGRDDRRPSAWINTKSGYYADSAAGSGDAAKTISLFDFAVKVSKFPDWQSARKAYAAKAGVEIGRNGSTRSKDDWHNRLILQDWSTPGNDVLALRWCMKHKPGVTVEAIKAAGGMLAYYPCHWDKEKKEVVRNANCRQVIAIPAYGEWFLDAEPVAWVCWDIAGHDIETATGPVKMVSVGLTRGTVMGLSSIMALLDPDRRRQIEWAWRVEGPADMLALWAAIPEELRDRHVVITAGSSGPGDVLPHQAKLLAGIRAAVCGDCDEAGVVGQAKWLRALDGLTLESRCVSLPWPTKPKHGEDVRDFLTGVAIPPGPPAAGGRKYSELLALAQAASAWASAASSANEAPESPSGAKLGASESIIVDASAVTDAQLTTFTEKQIIKALHGDVLGVDERGRAKVYSELSGRSSYFDDAAKIKYEHLLSVFGDPVKRVVSRNNEDSAPGMYPIKDVREAIALLSGKRLLTDDTEFGLGIWPCDDAIVLVNQSGAARYNGTGKLEKVAHPRHGDHLLAFDSGKPWYDFDVLGGLLQKAEDTAWRNQVIEDLYGLWSRWRWRGPYDPMILAGLVMATWIQSLWAWRPRVDLLGASNTGKSMLCAALAGIYQNLCLCTSDTTAAGLRQEICNRMMAVVVDEVDAQNEQKIKEQRKILEMIRSASRGTVSIRGTGSQKAVKFTLRHIVWVAGITLSYDSQADRNRAITMNLLPPLPEMAGKLVLPSQAELADLGYRSLATALWCANEACRIAVALKDVKVPGTDTRQVESYAVPAAMVWVAMGLDNGRPEEMLVAMLDSAKTEAGGVETDEESLIGAILRAQVRAKGGEVLAIGQAIEQSMSIHNDIAVRSEWKKVLGQAGIKIDIFGHSSGIPAELASQRAIILNYQTVKSIPLKGSRWYDQPIDQILRRIPGAKSGKRRVGGSHGACVMLPLEPFLEKHVGLESETVEQRGPNDF
jgi:hypothetical protein